MTIEKVQKRATKILKECKGMNYAERLTYLKLHSLKGRRLRGDLIQTFKIFNCIDDLPIEKLFKLTDCIYTNPTRKSEGKIFIRHCNFNDRKFSFSFRIAPHWNDLNPNVKFANSMNIFKNLLDGNPKFQSLFYQFDK